MAKSIKDRIEFLKKCADLYETSGNSPLTDVEYDKEYDECKKLDPTNEFFSAVGGLDMEHMYGTPFTHKYMMGSLNKSKNTEEFEEWFEKTHPDTHNLIAVLDLKVDGSSLCVHYEDGKLVRVVTRGDGTTGIDVTPNGTHIKGILPTIDVKGEVEVKGECYKNRQDFYKKWSKDVGGDYENPRNFVAGSINQKDPLVTKERGLNFVAYEVRGKDFETETKKILFLEELGFETLKKYIARIKCRGRTASDVARAIKNYMDKVDRENLPFDVDGIVFKLNDIKVAEAMGHTDSEGRRPKANRAVKFPAEQKETILEGIEWSIGRTGALTPVGLLKPVRLAGTTVKRVSLHNLSEIKRLGIKNYGCTVLVEKAGDIIPKVIRKTKDGTEKIKLSDKCPLCNSKMEWDENKITVWCKNDNCPGQINGNIEHWFKKIGVKGIGEGIISKLTAKTSEELDPFVSSLSHMYDLSAYEDELEDLFGKKAFANIQKSIGSVKELPLAKFIEALGIGKVGRTAKDIVGIAPTIEDVDKLVALNNGVALCNVDGFQQKKVKGFVDGWKKLRPEIDELLKYIEIKEVEPASDKLEGQKYCFTGSFSNPTRKEMEKLVEDNGGKKSSVSKNLTALVWDEEISGSKVDKAKKLGIPIITQKEFMEKLA